MALKLNTKLKIIKNAPVKFHKALVPTSNKIIIIMIVAITMNLDLAGIDNLS